MAKLPDEISFERWVRHVFDHPVLENQWWFHHDDEYAEEWNDQADPARTLNYLTRLFRQPAFLIKQYDRAQIDQGLNYIVSNACSNHMFVLLDTSLPWPDREACFDAMVPLYRNLMAPVYGDDIMDDCHEASSDRVNFSCYMWWDIIPIYGDMNHQDQNAINEAVFRVFRQVLQLRSEACLESALHGLGHWHLDFPERSEGLIRKFLRERRDISESLRRYAQQAATGMIQ